MFGLEIEYAVGHQAPRNTRSLSAEQVCEYMLGGLQGYYGLASPAQRSAFLPNGGKLYIDVGHVEWASPECLSVLDLIRYDLASERLMAGLVPLAEQAMHADKHDGEIFVCKNNVSPDRTTYGCHENYLVPRQTRYFPDPNQFFLVLIQGLLPFLVTRQILCGAGKLGYDTPENRDRSGYQIAQRSDFMTRETGTSSTSQRPIVHLKDEPLCDSKLYRRLHLLLGDANRSPWSILLKVGTTSLVLRMLIDNFLPNDLRVTEPITSIRAVSHDLSCWTPLTLVDDRILTPIEIQQHYLSYAQRYLAAAGSEEEQLVLDVWADTLEKLKRSPVLLWRRLDWVIKKYWLEKARAEEGWPWNDPRLADLENAYHDVRQGHDLHASLAEQGHVEPFPWLNPSIGLADAEQSPPADTRALLRGLAVAGKKAQVSWNWVNFQQSDSRFELDDPYVFHRPDLYPYLGGPPITHLRRALNSPSPKARLQAIEALQQSSGRGIISELLTHYAKADLSQRLAIEATLNQLTQRT